VIKSSEGTRGGERETEEVECSSSFFPKKLLTKEGAFDFDLFFFFPDLSFSMEVYEREEEEEKQKEEEEEVVEERGWEVKEG